jgi:hypothetical protein
MSEIPEGCDRRRMARSRGQDPHSYPALWLHILSAHNYSKKPVRDPSPAFYFLDGYRLSSLYRRAKSCNRKFPCSRVITACYKIGPFVSSGQEACIGAKSARYDGACPTLQRGAAIVCRLAIFFMGGKK